MRLKTAKICSRFLTRPAAIDKSGKILAAVCEKY
jgi:hypothetical protein